MAKKLPHLAFLVASLFSLGSVSALGQTSVPQSILDKCMKAADFQGCVNVMTGKTSAPTETKITVDMDKIRATGNSCPSGFAYIGGGYCQGIGCYYNPRGHDYRLGGKGWSCSGGNTLQFKGGPIRSTTDERCPLVEPEIGKQSSCSNGLSEAEMKSGRFIKRYPADRSQFGVRFDWDRSARKVSVVQVVPECTGYKIGLREGDLLVEYGGRLMPTDPERASQVMAETRNAKLDEFPIVVLRGSSQFSYVLIRKMANECELPEVARPF